MTQEIDWFNLRKYLPGPFMATDPELEDGVWRRAPRREPSSTVGEVFEVAPGPRWTMREPEWPGLYFCRHPGGTTRVVDVYAEGRTLYFEWSDLPSKPVRGSGLQWSDRAIREPAP